jgi:hypothetical protein
VETKDNFVLFLSKQTNLHKKRYCVCYHSKSKNKYHYISCLKIVFFQIFLCGKKDNFVLFLFIYTNLHKKRYCVLYQSKSKNKYHYISCLKIVFFQIFLCICLLISCTNWLGMTYLSYLFRLNLFHAWWVCFLSHLCNRRSKLLKNTVGFFTA